METTERAERSHNGSDHFLKGILIGGFLGATAGIVFAPKSGKELRSDLLQKGSETFEDAKHMYEDTRGKAEAILEDARRRAKELKDEADHLVSDARMKARQILCGTEGGRERSTYEEESGGEA
jgi:gas vesicle protein